MKCLQHTPPEIQIPLGTPAWITPERVADTLETWQPHYSAPLTVADAIDILQNVGQLYDLLESIP